MAYVLGIDGGGTKTVALAADLRGNVLGRGMSGASNYQAVGLDRAVAALKDASENAVVAAGMTTRKFKVVCLGLAGVGRERDRALLLPAIKKLDLADRIILEHGRCHSPGRSYRLPAGSRGISWYRGYGLWDERGGREKAVHPSPVRACYGRGVSGFAGCRGGNKGSNE